MGIKNFPLHHFQSKGLFSNYVYKFFGFFSPPPPPLFLAALMNKVYLICLVAFTFYEPFSHYCKLLVSFYLGCRKAEIEVLKTFERAFVRYTKTLSFLGSRLKKSKHVRNCLLSKFPFIALRWQKKNQQKVTSFNDTY